jgi:D-amino-acid dehydrogenase
MQKTEPQNYDVIVLGAGMVGISTALHAQRKGLRVLLLDKRDAGEETSYGNSGVIDGGNIFPTVMPREISELLKFALNNQTKAHYHLSALPRLAKWLYAYYQGSSETAQLSYAHTMREIFTHAVNEHHTLAQDAKAMGYFRETGWLKLYRKPASLAATAQENALAKAFGVHVEKLSPKEVLELEPHLNPVFVGGIWSKDANTISNPGALTKAYFALFMQEGGNFALGDARQLAQTASGWQVGEFTAPKIVNALGAWSMDILAPLGYHMPFAAKRGYHLHYKQKGNALLYRQVCDVDIGYVMCPMEQGTRITSGVEIALRDAKDTPVQLARLKPYADELFDLGEQVEPNAWRGNRPATPDSKPILGESRHQGLYFAFGHGHWGFTLGPATGRAMGELIAGQKPFIDLEPFSFKRF